MRKKWIMKDIADHRKLNGISDIVLDVLAARGVTSDEDIAEFLSPKPQRTYDPFLLKDMGQAVDKILEAIRNDTRICIYGDYDTDGVTAICLMLEFLGNLTQNMTYYIPSRFEEGYGLNKEAIDLIRNDGVGLIITVDCGSTAIAEVEYAKGTGMDIIVTDHHNIDGKAADCLVINAKQQDCRYPFKELCGCGVAFKLAQAIQRRADIGRQTLTKLLDLVAIATIGDIVPLIDENRTLVKYGMEIINKGGREGIVMLAQAAGLSGQTIRSHQIAYVLVPHLNAAGRMAEAESGVILLTAKENRSMRDAAATLVSNNNERKRIQEEDFRKCMDIAESKHANDLFMVIDAGRAHEGIAGIVAGKIKDAFGRPAIVVTGTNGDMQLKGTGRSIEGINIYEVLKKHGDLFIKFGGHAGACGFLMEPANLEILRTGLNRSINEIYENDSELFVDKLRIDLPLNPGDIDFELVSQVERLEPFGHRNEKPVFSLDNVSVDHVMHMGDERQHARFTVRDASGSIDCVLFNEAGEYRAELEKGSVISVAGYPDINTWNGSSKIQFVVRDIRWYSNRVD